MLDGEGQLDGLDEVLGRLRSRLTSKGAGKLPSVLVAGVVLGVDAASRKLTKLAGKLDAAAAKAGKAESGAGE
jgi:hypothetical protein